ncbi:MBL fold metallo-hydrolase [Devosia sp. 1566]|uniref:MBL fold metallo-hydrolase n=1 Tax=Devosia sp. 1566 TaxID=2499144 RepID=UPI0013E365B3|nr:MBL fold metallo-hydrolase [Devosia sp. 1566]
MAKGVLRLTAPNPGPGTADGTNTYLVQEAEGIVVIDPGPESDEHLSRILQLTHGNIIRILLTHGHPDHCTLAPALAASTGSDIWGYAPNLAPFALDKVLGEGETIGSLTAIHTPGHSPDHLCLSYGDGVLFTGDLVMGWASTVVSPPNGRMAHYFQSLRRLLSRSDIRYLPGHGPPVETPQERAWELLARRMRREAEIADQLSKPVTITALLESHYSHTAPTLRGAARRMVHAHLLKLADEGRVATTDGGETWVSVESAAI